MKKLLKLMFLLLLLPLSVGCDQEINSSNNEIVPSNSSEQISNQDSTSVNNEVGANSSFNSEINYDTSENNENEQINKIKEQLKSTPTKDGLVFAGWYSDEKLTNLVTLYSDLNGISKLYPKWISVYSKTYHVREVETTIKDEGRRKQRIDEVDLYLDYDYEGLIFAGYKNFEVEVSLDVKELDDGYQHVLLYSDTNCPNTGTIGYFITNTVLGKNKEDPSLLCWYPFEHCAGDKDSSWQTHKFTTNIAIEDLQDKLYIRYDASGKFNDDWVNKNVIVKVTPK